MKTAKHYLDEANGVVERISPVEGISRHESGSAVFIDVRDSSDIAKSGTIAGALRIPRGFLEFAADDSIQHHNPAMKKDQAYCLVCGAGGQAALAGKTLMEMGYTSIANVGGIGDWKDAGGPTEA